MHFKSTEKMSIIQSIENWPYFPNFQSCHNQMKWSDIKQKWKHCEEEWKKQWCQNSNNENYSGCKLSKALSLWAKLEHFFFTFYFTWLQLYSIPGLWCCSIAIGILSKPTLLHQYLIYWMFHEKLLHLEILLWCCVN